MQYQVKTAYILTCTNEKRRITQRKVYIFFCWKLSSVTTYITRCVRWKMSHESFNCLFSFILTNNTVHMQFDSVGTLGGDRIIHLFHFFFLFFSFVEPNLFVIFLFNKNKPYQPEQQHYEYKYIDAIFFTFFLLLLRFISLYVLVLCPLLLSYEWFFYLNP